MALTEFFVRYLQRRDSLSQEDLARLRSIPTETRSFQSGDEIVSAGPDKTHSCLMLRGMSARVHKLPGRDEQRAITALHFPGDFVDLHAFVLKGIEHSVVAVGPADAEFIAHDVLTEITENYPHLTRLLWLSTAIDAAIHRQWLVAANALRSSAHLAHLLCETYTRLVAVGAAGDNRLTLPLLQRELADILGYSPIHVNRAVRDLRDRGLVRWTGTEIEITDWQGLVQLARFDPDYLELRRRRR